MIILFQRFALAFILSLLQTAHASSDCNEARPVLFFVNGVLNSYRDADESLRALSAQTKNSFDRYELAYNTSEPILLQMLQVLRQKLSSESKFYWSYFSRLIGSDSINQELSKILTAITSSKYVSDADLQKHLSLYKKSLGAGEKLILVAHSQGNFYANEAFEILRADVDSQLPLQVIGVATPDRVVPEGETYCTLESDFLIRSIPSAPPYNVANSKHGFWDHEFVKHYLHGDSSGSKLMQMISDAKSKNIEYWSPGTKYSTPGYLHSSLNRMKAWLMRFEKEASSREIPKYQCLAISLFLKVENWWGEVCQERSLNSIREGAHECLKEEWSDTSRFAYSCQLQGLDGMMSPWRSPGSENRILDGHVECKWNQKSISAELTSQLLDQALKFISNPE